MTTPGKTWRELTPAERHEAAVAQDAADNFTVGHTAKRLCMSVDEVQSILDWQAATWQAGKAARIEAQRITWPKQAPENICVDCIALWARGVTIGRKAGVAEPRSIACCHPPHSDGTNYSVAFLAPCDPPRWLTFEKIPAADLNGLYAGLMEGGWLELVKRGNATSAAISAAATRGLEAARRRQFGPLVLGLAAAMGFQIQPTEDSTK